MTTISKKQVEDAIKGNEWNLGNKVLYDMCRQHPSHRKKQEVIAKIWLIGRSYAAAIERRKKNTGNKKFEGDDFYLKKVAPEILKSNIDDWINSLNGADTISQKNIQDILSVHLKVTELFFKISGMKKRSLASKYLHFHCPNLFFIYDSMAVSAISRLSDKTGHLNPNKYESDNEYRKFFERCQKIREYIKKAHKIDINPRSLDNLLLQIKANA